MGEEDLVTKDGEMIKVLAAFVTIFTGKTCLQQSQPPRSVVKIWSKEGLPLMVEDLGYGTLNQDIHKLMDLLVHATKC